MRAAVARALTSRCLQCPGAGIDLTAARAQALAAAETAEQARLPGIAAEPTTTEIKSGLVMAVAEDDGLCRCGSGAVCDNTCTTCRRPVRAQLGLTSADWNAGGD